ncbi:MAG: RNA polymerase sigma-70 factor (ECF subfamily) [Candidatus Krumholzibacteriia bacterium]|jgi:RNA polymerase sigma-70 factor (ECF subfamily)
MSASQDPDPFSGAQFLSRLKSRDQDTLRQLVNKYLPQIYRAAKGAGLNAQNAEDVTQDVFVTFLEKIDDFGGRSHVRTWLFGILYHKTSEMRRVAQKEGFTSDIDSVMENKFQPNGKWVKPPRESDESAYEGEIRRHLAECLEGVVHEQRMAFILREVEDLATDEICRILDVTRNHLGVLLYRGRNQLRECLENRNVNSA